MRPWLATLGLLGAAVLAVAAPERIASYSPGATQTLLDLGSSAQIIATTRWCPLPKTHPAVRTCDAFNPDLETLLQAKPDLVILPRLANPLWAERCTRAGLKIIILQTEGPDSVTRDLELLGEATHQQVAAKALRARLDRPAASGPRTLLIVWDGMMAGPDAYTTPVLKQAGFKSPLQAGTWVKLDWELLVQANPDAILWIDSKPENTPISPSQSRQKELSQIIVVKELKSVKTSQIYATTSGSHWLPGSGLILASEKLTELSKVLK